MLNRRNRMGESEVIGRLAKSGNSFRHDFLLFRYLGSGGGASRFTVSVSKKIYANAVDRNRLRRQILEAIQANLPLLKIGVEALISARPSILKSNPDFKTLGQAVISFFNFLNSHAK
jgi:ribonuclease P protein component